MQRPRLFSQPWARTVAMWGAPSLIESIQYGTVTIATGASSGTATIAAVDTQNAMVSFLGFSEDTNTDPGNFMPRVALTNATTVTATRNATPTPVVVLSFVVVEFAPGVVRSIQSGTITISGATSNTATITAVNTAKTWLIFNNALVTTGQSDALFARVTLTNATTITASRNTNVGAVTVGYCAVEFH